MPTLRGSAHRIAGDHHRQSDIAARRPRATSARNGILSKSISSPRQTRSWHGALPDRVRGGNFASSASLREHREFGEQAVGHLQVEHVGDAVADVVETLDAERESSSAGANQRG